MTLLDSGNSLSSMTTTRPPVAPPPTWPPSQAPARRAWPTTALAAIAAVLAAAALIVSLTRSPGEASPPPAPDAPGYTAAEVTAANDAVCEAYELAARDVRAMTNGDSPSLAGLSTANAAGLLRDSVSDNPAVEGGLRDSALALATAYRTLTANGSSGTAEWRNVADDANAKSSAMRDACG